MPSIRTHTLRSAKSEAWASPDFDCQNQYFSTAAQSDPHQQPAEMTDREDRVCPYPGPLDTRDTDCQIERLYPEMDSILALPHRPTVHRRRQLSPPQHPVYKSQTHNICILGNRIMGASHAPDDVRPEVARRSPHCGNEHAGASDQVLLHDNHGYAVGWNSKSTMAPLHGKGLMRESTRTMLA